MSSSRSIAGARQRRAGEAPPVSGRNNSTVTSQQFLAQQQQQQQQQLKGNTSVGTSAKFQSLNTATPGNFGNSNIQQQQQQQQPSQIQSNGIKQGPMQIGNGPGKLSVSDAFALVTLRLGKLETLTNKWQEEGVPDLNNKTELEGSYIDPNVLEDIIHRIQQVEGVTVDLIESKKNEVVTTQMNDTYSSEIQRQIQELEKKIFVNLDEKVDNIVKDILEIKDTLLKLQAFTMETNQKLVNAIFQENENDALMMQMMKEIGVSDESENDEDDDDEEIQLDGDDDKILDSEEIQVISDENVTVNLKELIDNELKLNDNVL